MFGTITYLSFRALYPYQTIRSYFIFQVINPLIHYGFFAVLGLVVVGKTQYIVVGNILFLSASTMIANVMSLIRRERTINTLELNIAAPFSTTAILFSRTLVPALDSLFVMIIGFVFAILIFGVRIPTTNLFPMVLLIISVLISMFGFALIATSFSLPLRNSNLYLNIVLGLLQILCGVNFPISVLPNWAAVISNCLPLTHALEGIRSLIEGAVPHDPLWYATNETIRGVLYLFIGIMLFRIFEAIARKNGSFVK